MRQRSSPGFSEGPVGAGASLAPNALVSRHYDDLRAIAAGMLRPPRGAETLQATALVHEAFLKLGRAHAIRWKTAGHFLAVATMAMRQILANRAEQRRTLKRGGGRRRAPLIELGTPSDLAEQIDVLDVDEALVDLAEFSPDLARVVALRFQRGLTQHEIARTLGVSTRTVRRRWREAREFLQVRLDGGENRPDDAPRRGSRR